MATTEIRNLKELKAAFKELNIRFGKNAVTGVALAQLSYLADVQKISPYKTGTYRRSIHASVPEEREGMIVGYVGTDLEYAKRLEYGFADTDKLGRTYNQPPRPHFRPPLDQNKEKYIEIMRRKMFS